MPGRRVLLPFGLVVVALVALVIVPLFIRDRTRDVRADIRRIADPARQEINTVQLQLAHELAALITLGSTGAARQREVYMQAKARAANAVERLHELAQALGSEALPPFRRVRALLIDWHSSVADAELLNPTLDPDLVAQRLLELIPLYERTTAATVTFALSIQRAIDERTATLARIQQLDFTLTALLVLLALASALGAGWLAWRLQRAATAAESRMTELEEAEGRLRWLIDSRARLMRGFTHDLKNPLSAADGQVQLVQEGITGELTDKTREAMQRVRGSLASAFELIEDLLEFARAETGALEVRRSIMDVRRAAEQVAEEYRGKATAKGLDYEIDLAEDLPLIKSDAHRLRQVLGNLLSNAVKYTEQGKITLRAAIRARPDEHHDPHDEIPAAAARDDAQGQARDYTHANARSLAIDVADTGPGIPRDKQHKIFDEFARVAPSGGGGAGIGLAISQRIAHALGGDITFQSEEGLGSTFTLWLPTTETQERPDAAD